MGDNFPTALALVLKAEGGFVNDPHDPGGATNFGITQSVYDAYRATEKVAKQSVRLIASAEVALIYRRQYWAAVQGDSLPAGVSYCVFDEAVNSGPKPGIKDLQAAIGVTADGVFGLKTAAAVQQACYSAASIAEVINRMCDLRLNLLHRLVTWRWFKTGWSNRVAATRAASLKLAAGLQP